MKSLLVIVALAGATLGRAQDSFDFHVGDMVILMLKPVQKALAISDAQRGQMNAYAQNFNAQAESYRQKLIKSKGKPDYQKLAAMQLNLKTQVFAKLSATQLKRLREISLQHDGVSALGDEVVAKKVGLSALQLKKIRDVITRDRTKTLAYEQEAAKPIIEKYKNLKPKTQAEAKALQDKAHAEMVTSASKFKPEVEKMVTQDRAAIIGTLDVKQRTLWDSLLGKPFTGQ